MVDFVGGGLVGMDPLAGALPINYNYGAQLNNQLAQVQPVYQQAIAPSTLYGGTGFGDLTNYYSALGAQYNLGIGGGFTGDLWGAPTASAPAPSYDYGSLYGDKSGAGSTSTWDPWGGMAMPSYDYGSLYQAPQLPSYDYGSLYQPYTPDFNYGAMSAMPQMPSYDYGSLYNRSADMYGGATWDMWSGTAMPTASAPPGGVDYSWMFKNPTPDYSGLYSGVQSDLSRLDPSIFGQGTQGFNTFGLPTTAWDPWGGMAMPSIDPNSFNYLGQAGAGGVDYSSFARNVPPYDQASLYSGIGSMLGGLGQMQPTSPGDLGYGAAFGSRGGYDPYFGSVGGGTGLTYDMWGNPSYGGGTTPMFQPAATDIWSGMMGLNALSAASYLGDPWGNAASMYGGFDWPTSTDTLTPQDRTLGQLTYDMWGNPSYTSAMPYSGMQSNDPSLPGGIFTGQFEPLLSSLPANFDTRFGAYADPWTAFGGALGSSTDVSQYYNFGGAPGTPTWDPTGGAAPPSMYDYTSPANNYNTFQQGSFLPPWQASIPSPMNSPATIDAVKQQAALYGYDPAALAAMIQKESNWNPALQTGSYSGLTQMGPKTFAEAGGTLGGMTWDQYEPASPAAQISAYSDWLNYYSKNPNTAASLVTGGIGSLPREMQAAIMQGTQFSPNATYWPQALAEGNMTMPTTTKPQGPGVGDTSIAAMNDIFAQMMGQWPQQQLYSNYYGPYGGGTGVTW